MKMSGIFHKVLGTYRIPMHSLPDASMSIPEEPANANLFRICLGIIWHEAIRQLPMIWHMKIHRK